MSFLPGNARDTPTPVRPAQLVRPAPSQGPRLDQFSWRRRFLGLVVFCAASIAAPGGQRLARAADEAAPDTAPEGSEAQIAYEHGVEQFRAGNFAAACDFLAESYRLEPLPGVLFTWATCELRADRVASAATHYGAFVDAVGRLSAADRLAQDERRQVAQRERARILPEIPYLTVTVAAEAIHTSTVHRDGELVPPELLGVEVPVDPGEHVIDFDAADGSHAQQRVVLAKHEHKTIVLGFAKAREVVQRLPPPVTPSKRHMVSPWVYVAGGVGVSGVLTGSIAGVLAIRDKRVVDDECTGPGCTKRGKDAADTARVEATVSTVGFAVGFAGLITSAILYAVDSSHSNTASAAPRRTWAVAITPTSVGVGGAF